MKVHGKKLGITLTIGGQEMTFSKDELSNMVEEHIRNKMEACALEQQKTVEKIAEKPTEDEWFEVKPRTIDQMLFEEERKKPEEERIRKLILEAFVEMERIPQKYGRNFKTMFPKKDWAERSVSRLIEMAYVWGDHNANWIEQALEWAQRIANGETWEAVCNYKDTSDWYRLIIWKNGYARLVGAMYYDFHAYEKLYDTVPLVVLYE